MDTWGQICSSKKHTEREISHTQNLSQLIFAPTKKTNVGNTKMNSIIQTSSVCFFHMRSFKQSSRNNFQPRPRWDSLIQPQGKLATENRLKQWDTDQQEMVCMSYIICHQLVYIIRVYTYLMCLWMTVHTVYMCVYIYIKYIMFPFLDLKRTCRNFPCLFLCSLATHALTCTTWSVTSCARSSSSCRPWNGGRDFRSWLSQDFQLLFFLLKKIP